MTLTIEQQAQQQAQDQYPDKFVYNFGEFDRDEYEGRKTISFDFGVYASEADFEQDAEDCCNDRVLCRPVINVVIENV